MYTGRTMRDAGCVRSHEARLPCVRRPQIGPAFMPHFQPLFGQRLQGVSFFTLRLPGFLKTFDPSLALSFWRVIMTALNSRAAGRLYLLATRLLQEVF